MTGGVDAYAGLFASAFLAATLVPMSSEAVLAALRVAGGHDALRLLAVASLANTLGSVVNWALGRWCLHWQGRRWFPVSEAGLAVARDRFARWGTWSLLLAWLPVVGDPLTFAAGVLRVDFRLFVVLVAAGKTARYAAVLAAAQGFL